MSGFAKCMLLGSAVFDASTAAAIKSATASIAVEEIRLLANVRIGSRLSSLLEEVATAATGATPGIIDQMDNIISEVDGIVTAITNAQDTTQNNLNNQFQAWEVSNGLANGAKSGALSAVSDTSACVSIEQDILTEFQTPDAISGLDTETVERNAADAVKDLKFSEPLFPNGNTVFQCDTEDPTIACSDARVSTWSGDVQTQLDNMAEGISDQRADWQAKKNRYVNRATFDAQHTTCEGNKADVETAVCSFGSTLLASCAAKTTYKNTKTATGESGNVDSDVDRQDEYRTAKLVACLALEFKTQGDKLADKDFLKERATACQDTIAGDTTIKLTFGDEEPLVSFPCSGGFVGVEGSAFIADATGRVSLDSYAQGTNFEYTATSTPFEGCSSVN